MIHMGGMGERIKKMRERVGMGQRQLARLSSVPQTTISRIESGLREPSAAETVLLADAVGATVGEITGDSYVERESVCAARAVGDDVDAMQRELVALLEVSDVLDRHGFVKS